MSRVVLSPNIQRNKPIIFYSDSTEVGILKAYNIDKGKVTRTIMAHNTAIFKMACDLDGNIVVTTSTNGDVIRLWSADKGHKLATFKQRPYTELNSISIGQGGLVTTFSQTGYLETFLIPEEALSEIQSSSYSFPSSELDSEFMSNDVFNSPSRQYEVVKRTTDETNQKSEKETFSSFCGHFKQSFAEMFSA